MNRDTGSRFEWEHGLWRDPRHYQIAVLSTFLILGFWYFDFGPAPQQAALTLAAALLAQALAYAGLRIPSRDFRSSIITGLSLCLLLRASHPGWMILAATLSIWSKFLIRWRGRHIFNPANFGIVLLLVLTNRVWVSAGQWGSSLWLGFFISCLASMVLGRAGRWDISLGFLAAYGGLLLVRALYLGETLAIPQRQFLSGSLLLFAFFMISDPKTVPESRRGRLVFAGATALLAVGMQHNFYYPITNGLFFALPMVSLLLPVLEGTGFLFGESAKSRRRSG